MKQHHCGCENSDCEVDPNEMSTPHTVPMRTLKSISGGIIQSVAYPDLGEFLFQYYYCVNKLVDAIKQKFDSSICSPNDCEQ